MAHQIEKIKELADQGASAENISQAIAENSAWLTDHGPEHVSTVIDRAALLVTESKPELTPYEIYILLASSHFHDVGNIFGREGHEARISEVMQSMESAIIGDDSSEKRLIRDIAAAHGGKVNGDKDTIGHLPVPGPYSKPQVRARLLAAILRFADELADDCTRAARWVLEQDQIGEASEIFHVYADRLRKVTVANGSVHLDFELDKAHVLKTYGKGAGKVFLLDEIFDRTLKMHLEHLYCMRFMRPYLAINRIVVDIAIYTDKFMTELVRFSYALEEKGYPVAGTSGIYAVASPTLVLPSSEQRLTGQTLKDYFGSF